MSGVGFPYSCYRCSCASSTAVAPTAAPSAESNAADNDDDTGEEEETFDPSNPRSNFSLYPLDSLMWCEDCHDIRCSRCTVEEIVCWYCPNCLFEVPSSTVKSDGNRCTRNCFSCPECTSQLQTLSLDPDPTSNHGPYILNCTFCHWTSLDVNLKFDSPRHILEQLRKSLPSLASHSQQQRRIASRTGTSTRLETVPEPEHNSSSSSSAIPTPRSVSPSTADARKPQDAATRFHNLKAFYKEQLGKSGGGGGSGTIDSLRSPGADVNFSSPGNIERIMNLYSNPGGPGASPFPRKPLEKPRPMREVSDVSEGFSLFSADADVALVSKLRETWNDAGLQGTVSRAQRAFQVGSGLSDAREIRFLGDLKPVPTLLCTKRSARCSVCRHILVKPEPKIGTTRYRIKLIASEKVPRLTLKPLIHPAAGKGGGNSPTKGPSANMAEVDLNHLPARQTLQFLLKLTNPMFDTLRISLATPAEIPSAFGRGRSKVTILCPDFEVGANSDMWDEALGGNGGRGGRGEKDGDGGDGKTAVAGRVWERGRNWTTVVVEVVPETPQTDGERMLGEDGDVLEIPVFVRATYEAEVEGDKAALAPSRGGREKRTLTYWAVLGVGRIDLR